MFRTIEAAYHDDAVDHVSLDTLAALFFATGPRDRMFYTSLFENLRSIEATNESVYTLCRSLRKGQLLKELSMAAYSASEGDEKAQEKLTQLQQQLSALGASKEAEQENEFAYVEPNLDELLDKTYLSPGLRWRLDSLNKSLGSLRKSDFGFVFARPESFSRDTEVLTPQGWLPVDKVTAETYISQVNPDLTTTFVQPLAVHPHEQEECYHIHDTLGRVDLIVTKGHGMVVDKGNGLVKERADEVQYKAGIKHHVSASTNQRESVVFDDLTRLQIAYQADGRTREYITHGYSKHLYGYEISVLKERKVSRLKDILQNVPYSSWVDKRGHTGFYIKSQTQLYKDFDWINLKDVNQEWCQKFIEELSYWDATRRTNYRFKFDTTNKKVADKVQAIATLAGYNCLMSRFEDNRKETYSDLYSLSIRTVYQPVDGQSIKKELIPFSDTTYCFEVPSGMLLVRRNGAVAVSGNTGKTTFLTSEGSYFAEQAVEKDLGPVLHLNNEGEDDKILLRYYQSVLGATLPQILSNREKAQRVFMEKTQGKIVLPRLGRFSKTQLERLLEKHKPCICVVDQVDHIQGFTNDREDLRLGAIYEWLRELAKLYCPIIGVTQADGSGEGTKWLTMANVANAKTSKQAAADFILGIGKVHDNTYDKIRFLSLSKNKCLGDPDTDPKWRHRHWECVIEAEVARYRDL